VQYHPTWVEWTITAGAFAVFLLLFTLFAKVFPIVSIWETIEGVEEVGAEKIGVVLEPKPAPVVPPTGHSGPGLAAGAAVLIGCLLVANNQAWAGEAVSPKPQAQVTITAGIEEGKKMIIAKVMREGKPIENAHVVLQTKRTFGNLTLGEDDTLADGTVAVAFPTDLPGGAEGKLLVLAQVKSPPECAGASGQAVLEGALQLRPEPDAFPRALWSPRAPLALLITIGALLTIVWSTYLFVLIQLIRIRKAANNSL
jgi:hypothetical protein